MKKEVAIVSTLLGVSVSSSFADNLVSYETGKVSDSRYILASAEEMTCGKEMKEKVKKCKQLMKDMKCGAAMKKEMEECNEVMKKMKTKDKTKEMACGKCGSMM